MSAEPAADIPPRFTLCIANDGFDASLEIRKVYRALPDEAASAEGLVRVIDESGEDYLFRADWFVPLDLPPDVSRELAAHPA